MGVKQPGIQQARRLLPLDEHQRVLGGYLTKHSGRQGECFCFVSNSPFESNPPQDCRSSAATFPSTKYAFEGCYTSFVNTITDNQQIVVGVAIGVVVVMVSGLR